MAILERQCEAATTVKPRVEKWVEMTLFLLCVGLLGFLAIDRMVASWSFNTDDAFITLRYAKNWVESGSIVWNIGDEPVEGYTNFLFVMLGAAALLVGLDPVLTLKVLSVCALAGTTVIQYRLSRLWAPPGVALVAPALLLLYDGTIWWTVSGLETAVYQFICLLTIYILAISDRGESKATHYFACGLLAFVASLTRFEGPILIGSLGIGVLIFDLLRAKKSGPLTSPVTWQVVADAFIRYRLTIAAFAIPYAAYFVWRWWFYGHLLPNSVRTKDGFAEDPYILVRTYLEFGWPVLLAAGFGLIMAMERVTFAMAAFVIAYTVLLIDVDPIVGHFNRHFLTVHAVSTVLAAIAAGRLVRMLPRPVFHPLASWVGAGIVLSFSVISQAESRAKLTAMAAQYAHREHARLDVARWLNANVESDAYVAVGDAGVIPYAARAKVIDLLCLNSLACTSVGVGKDPARFANHVLKSAPQVVILQSWSATKLQPREPVFHRIAESPALQQRYQLKAIAPSPMFNYWIYQKR